MRDPAGTPQPDTLSMLTIKGALGERVDKAQEKYREIQNAIYGPDDDRSEINDIGNINGSVKRDQVMQLARSVVAIIHIDRLTKSQDGKTYTVNGTLLREISSPTCTNGLCNNVKYGDQISCVRGTGFIVSKTKFITANHVLFGLPLQNYLAVENYTPDKKTIDKGDVHELGSFVDKQNETRHKRADFAVIQIKDKFSGKKLSINSEKAKQITNGKQVFMIGFPSGLPMKVTSNAYAYGVTEFVFQSDIDAFAGNSGSPVFNERGEVEGILITGAADYISAATGTCCNVTSYSVDISNPSERETVLRLPFILTYAPYFAD